MPQENSTTSSPRPTSPLASSKVLPCSSDIRRAEIVEALLDQALEVEHHALAAQRRRRRPGELRLLGDLHRGIDFRFRGEGHLGRHLAGRRVGDVAGAAALARHALVVDVMPDLGRHLALPLFGALLRAHQRRTRKTRKAPSGEAAQDLAIALAELVARDMAAVLHHRHATAIDGLDRRIVGGEQPGIEQAVVLAAASEGCWWSSTTKSARLPGAMPPIVSASVACAPPASAASNNRRPVERVASPSTLRCRCIRRWPYSSVRSSSAAEMRISRSPSRCRSGRPGPGSAARRTGRRRDWLR